MEHIERVDELNSDEIENYFKQGYQKISFYKEEYLYDPYHWSRPQHNQYYDYMFDDICFIALTPEARQLAASEGYELSAEPIINLIMDSSMTSGVYSQDEIEGSLGGSLLDDLLNQIGYPPESQLIWEIVNDRLYCRYNNTNWYICPLFDSDTGNFLHEWTQEP